MERACADAGSRALRAAMAHSALHALAATAASPPGALRCRAPTAGCAAAPGGALGGSRASGGAPGAGRSLCAGAPAASQPAAWRERSLAAAALPRSAPPPPPLRAAAGAPGARRRRLAAPCAAPPDAEAPVADAPPPAPLAAPAAADSTVAPGIFGIPQRWILVAATSASFVLCNMDKARRACARARRAVRGRQQPEPAPAPIYRASHQG